jgi:stress-induced morphogen
LDLREKVTAILKSAFQPERILLEDADGITGYVISPKFRGLDSYDRQTMIYDVLQGRGSKLNKAQQRQILLIAALTPEEYALHAAD